MIGFLKGTLAGRTAESVLVDVDGMGFEVSVPLPTLRAMPAEGEEITLFTRLVVREDSLTLYGFLAPADKDLFDLLMTVQGVGPKSALTVLSGLAVPDLIRAILQGNVALLKSVPGVGSKTAQRLVVELKDKVERYTGAKAVRGGPLPDEDVTFSDAVQGLVHLGYRQAEAREAVRRALQSLPVRTPLEQLVKASLRNLSRT